MRIFKYTLAVEDEQTFEIPAGAKLLTVQLQHGVPKLWAIVDETRCMVRKVITTYGTGQPLPDIPDFGVYLGTYQLHGGAAVFHVFDQTDVDRG